eukprot:365815-Chlamydomonas_euryale.AAC.1
MIPNRQGPHTLFLPPCLCVPAAGARASDSQPPRPPLLVSPSQPVCAAAGARASDSKPPRPPHLVSPSQPVCACRRGARECVKLYHDGTILDIYRTAREHHVKRPWAIDHFDALAERMLG